jgi:pimeloyl-ACP methyl ester carboxylesterase
MTFIRDRVLSTLIVATSIAFAPAHAGLVRTNTMFPAGRSAGFPVADTFEYSINVETIMPAGPCAPHARNVFMVHGFGDNARLFEPLATALVASGKACRAMAIDLPAHGASTVSDDPRFGPRIWGEIDIVEEADVVDQVLSALKNKGVAVNTIVGHSTGGLIVQRLQSEYASRQNTSLKAKFGIDTTILIASDIPRALPWAAGDAPIAAGYAKGLTVNLAHTDPAPYGTRVFLDYATYLALKYSVGGVPVPAAPSQNAALVLNDPEPYASAANIVGLDPTGQTTNDVPRLYVSPAPWSGYTLKVIWPDKDIFFTHAEMDALADYLKPGTNAIVVSDAQAVHAVQYTRPDLLLPLF